MLDKTEPGARVCLHIDPQTQIDIGLLPCEPAHGLTEHLRACVDGLLGFEDA